MAMYALGITPLIRAVSTPGAEHEWFADDATTGGHLEQLRTWWDQVANKGPAFGYHANTFKSWLMVKEEHLPRAERMFAETGVHITCMVRRHLGAALGTQSFVEEFVMEKVSAWKTELECLSPIARSEPHAAFSAFTHGLFGHWMYFLRTVEGLSSLMQPLKDTIRQRFLPVLTRRDSPSDMERELLALPARHGGLGLVNPTTMEEEHTFSLRPTAPLTALIVQQNSDLGDTRQLQQSIKTTLRAERRRKREEVATDVKAQLPQHLQRAAELGSKKGAHSWVTVLPITAHGFTLHKGAFRDALCLRYNLIPPDLPRECVCGTTFTTEHALSCPTGGVTICRHHG